MLSDNYMLTIITHYQIGSVPENPAHFTAGVAANWGGYDMQRGGARR